MDFMNAYKQFTVSAERFNFDGQPANYLVLKGPVANFPFKMILPSQYPARPPMLYLDQ